MHKDLFPAVPLEIVGYVLFPIMFAIASVGGVGGGIILLPMMIAFFHFPAKDAVAVCSVIVTESAVIRFAFFSAHTKHPARPHGTEIDYNLVRIAFPSFMIGSYFGVILSVSLGELILAVLLMVLMTFLAFQTLHKAIKLYRKETAEFAAKEPKSLASVKPAELNAE